MSVYKTMYFENFVQDAQY